jgi:hypothetical protein
MNCLRAKTHTSSLALRLPRKNDAAHKLSALRLGSVLKAYDAHHVVEACVASPQALKSRRTIAPSIEVPTLLSDDDHGFTQGESFF